MAKAGSISRLLRSMVRAGKAQQRLSSRLIAAALPGSTKRPTRPGRKAPPRTRKAPDVRQPDGPNASPPPGKWTTGQFPYSPEPHGGQRLRMHYWLYRPDHMPNTVVRQGWPLIVMLHGCHQSATQFAKGTGMNRLAESKGYAVLYPQQPLRAHPHRCWRWYAPPVQHGGGEAAALVGLIELVCAEHLVNRRRIYVCGISAGAGMAAILALNRPDLFAAVGLHSAPIFGAARSALDGLRVMRHGSARTLQVAIDQMVDLHAARAPLAATVRFPSIPAILIHGDADKAVHPVNQEQLTQQWLSINGIFPDAANQCVTRKPAGRGGRKNAHEIHDYLVGGKPVVRVVRINELGHEWSGGDPSERFNAQAGPDASHMIVNFFSKHRR